jgi:hypothetical protein
MHSPCRPVIAASRPFRSFQAASPPLECGRSLGYGGSCSDVGCGWIPAIQGLMRHREGSALGGSAVAALPASLCSPKGADRGRGLSRPGDEKVISPNSSTGSTRVLLPTNIALFPTGLVRGHQLRHGRRSRPMMMSAA